MRRRWSQRYLRLRIAAGTKIGRHHELSRLVFDRDGPWMRDPNGALWAYRPELGTFGLLEGRLWEPGEVDLLSRHLAAGGVFVDVGAGIGTFAVELARRIPELQVHAFEPVDRMREALLANVAKNSVGEQVQVSQSALLDRSGRVPMTNRASGTDHVVADGSGEPVELVDAMTLDAYLEAHDVTHVDAIKIDVEGAELLVLRGATATLNRDHPLLIMEVEQRWTGRFGYDASTVFDVLGELGYTHERMEEWRVEPSTGDLERDLSLSSNFVFRAPPH